MKRISIIIITMLVLVFLFTKAKGQTDKEFWFAAPDLSTAHCDDAISFRFVTLDHSATVTLTSPANSGFVPLQITIPAYQSGMFDLQGLKSVVECPADVISDYGLHITSSAWIQASYEVNCNNLELFPLKGRNALGTSFVIPFQQTWNNNVMNPPTLSSFTIVATEDNTTVTVTPAHDIIGHAAGVPFQFVLNRGQSYSAVASSVTAANHLGGSFVTSDKAVAVSTADDSVLTNLGMCLDLLGDQMVPENNTGQDYIVVKGNLPAGNDRFYVYATADNTGVYLNGNASPVVTINRGEYYASTLSQNSIYIHSSANTYVIHVTGSGCEVADALVPPLMCTGNYEVNFYHPTTSNLYGMVIVPAGGEGNFTVAGSTSTITSAMFSAAPGTGGQWLFAKVNLQNVTSPSVRVANSSHKFIMGFLNTSSSGCSYGYFTDYGPMRLDLGNDTSICPNQTLLLNAGYPGSSYLWQDGSANQFFLVSSPGCYQVTVTNGQGCTDTTSVQVSYYNSGGVTWDEMIPAKCVTDPPFTLTGGNPEGGTYSGLGVVGNTFSPGIGAGNYTLMYTIIDANGCEQSVYNTLTVNLLPAVYFFTNLENQCVTLTEYVLSGGEPYGGTYSGPGVEGTNFNASLAGPGTHWITYSYTDDNGCTNSISNFIIVRDVPTVTFDGTLDAQCASFDMYLLTGGSPLGGTYTGTGVTGFVFNASVAGVGLHKIYYSYKDVYGCVGVDSNTITVYPLPVVTWSINYSPRCVSSNAFLLSGAMPPGGYYQGPGTSGNAFSPALAGPGTHTVSYFYMDNHGCTNSATAQIVVNPLPEVSFSASLPDVCITLPPFNFTQGFPPGGTYSGGGVVNNTFYPADAGAGIHTITYTYTNGNNCTNSVSAFLPVFDVPQVAVVVDDDIVCSGSPFILSSEASGGSSIGYLFSWQGPSSFISTIQGPITVTGTVGATGYYVVTLTDSHGCIDKDSVYVTVNPTPDVVASSNSPVCAGASLTLNADPGNMSLYQWSGPGGYTSVAPNPVRSNAIPSYSGIYTVTITNSFDCQGVASTTVVVNPLPVADAGPDQTINYGTYTSLNGMVSSCSGSCGFSWVPLAMINGSTNISNPVTVNLTVDQDYTLTLLDQNTGCNSPPDGVTIHVTGSALAVDPVAAPGIICQGGSSVLTAQASGGNQVYTYSWSPAVGLSAPDIADPVAAPLTTTTYFVTVSDGYNQTSGQVSVTVEIPPYANAGPDTILCGCNPVTLDQAVVSNIQSFAWTSPGDGFFDDPYSLSTTYNPGPLDCQNASFTLILTGDAFAPCEEARDSLIVTVLALTSAEAGADDTICEGEEYLLSQSLVVNADSIHWSSTGDGSFDDASLLHPLYTPGPGDITSGSVLLTLLSVNFSPACGDSASSMVLTIKPKPSANAGSDVDLCNGDTIQLHANGGDTYSWLPATGLSDDSIPDPLAFPAVTTVYSVSVMLNGCRGTDDVKVTVYQNPVLSLSSEQQICQGDSVKIWADGTVSYQWSNGAESPSQWVSPSMTTFFYVTGYDEHNCHSTGQVSVVVHPTPVLTVTPADTSICLGNSVSLTVHGANFYTWSPKKGLSSPYGSVVQASPEHTQVYTITGTSVEGCKGVVSTLVTVVERPVLRLPDSSFICLGDKLIMNAGWNDDVTYAWQDGSHSQFYAIYEPGVYYVVATNSGCKVSDTVRVYTCAILWAPNAFTPNADGLNDIFLVKATTDLINYQIYIFSRKGEMVYESTDIHTGWDGRFKGEVCEPGVFTWMIYYKSRDAGAQLMKGTVTLLR